MKRRIVFLGLLLLLPPAAHALCVNLAFGNVPSLVTFEGGSGGYAVYDPQEYLQTVSFEVRGEATGATCEYFVTLSAGQSGDFNQRKLSEMTSTLNYNAYTDSGKSGILKALPTATQNEIITGSFPVVVALTQTNAHKFFWTIAPQQVVPAADTPYTDGNLTLSLYSGLLFLSPTLEATKTIRFQARVDSSVDVSLVESGQRFDISDTTQLIDFGTLESGEQRGFDVVVRSNDGYVVTMQSQNQQLLIHARAPAISDVVSYSIIFNGGGIDLSTGAPVPVIAGSGTTPATGVSFPIEFTVGTLSGEETAGTYADVIYVEVTAN
ncbi:MAG: spore coat protein U domain-containing protein [Gammaproteobacteria bacterium]|nr:spore coat protein U domain-containing protein [Gammaproteobacteria bacterium]